MTKFEQLQQASLFFRQGAAVRSGPGSGGQNWLRSNGIIASAQTKKSLR